MIVLPCRLDTPRRRSSSRTLRAGRGGRLTLVLAAALALATVAGPSDAHTDLVSSSPADGARLDTPPRQVRLEFSEAVDPSFATVVLTRAGTEPTPLDATNGPEPGVVLAAIPTQGRPEPAGAWSVAYRVTSVDGHPIQGRLDFVLTEETPPGGTPSSPGSSTNPLLQESESPTASESTSTGSDEPGSGIPWRYAGPAFLLFALFMLATLLALARLSPAPRSPAERTAPKDEVTP